MIIVAKFASTCPKCRNAIAVGSKVEWSKGSKATHVACPAPSAAAGPDAPKAVKSELAIVEKWEPCRRAGLNTQLAAVVGETRRYERAHGAVAPGLYVVTGHVSARYESADDADDMGDMNGAGWIVVLALRAATEEEIAKDIAERIARSMIPLGHAIARANAEMVERVAREEMAAAAARPDYVRAELWTTPDWTRGGSVLSDRVERTQSGAVSRSNTISRVETTHGVAYVQRTYIYDWDQPLVVVGPRELVEPVVVAEAMRQFGHAVAGFARRAAA
jgi:hypothetical protein